MIYGQTIRIGLYEYAVVDNYEQEGEDPKNYWGRILFKEQLIYVQPDIHAMRQRAVVIHEVLHGILEDTGHDDENEAHIKALGVGLVAFMRDNPHVVDYIMEGVKRT